MLSGGARRIGQGFLTGQRVQARPALRLLLALTASQAASCFLLHTAHAFTQRASSAHPAASETRARAAAGNGAAAGGACAGAAMSGGSGLSTFLKESRSGALDFLRGHPPPDTSLVLVMGNEACDADSVASAISLAYAASMGRLPTLAPPGKALVAPVVNIPREDLALRQDVVLMLKDAGVDSADLVFFPEIPEDGLRGALSGGGLRLVLTDHNKLGVAQEWLAPAVVGVVDHHEDTGSYGGAALRVVDDKVGTCCALVAREMVGGGGDMGALRGDFGDGVVQLLGAALVLDTRLFKGKCTDLDRALGSAIGYLEGGEASGHAEGRMGELSRAREDVTGLTSSEKLRKDYKRWGEGARAYGIATVPCSVQDWSAHDPQWASEVAAFGSREGVPLVLTMLTFTDAGGEFRRQLLVHSTDAALLEACCAHLEGPDHPAVLEATGEGSLKLQRVGGLGGVGVVAYGAGNLRASRKQVQPVVEAFMSGR